MDDPLWRYVGDWPQIPGYLRQTLDENLIPQQATAVLRRSLELQRVIAFVGSGASMSYGRLGWGEAIKWMTEKVPCQSPWTFAGKAPIDPLRVAADGSTPSSPTPTKTQQRMQKLLEDLDVSNRTAGLDLQSGSYPAAFQFLEQCAVELSGPSNQVHPPRESRVRRCLRALLSDDAGQAYLLFERLLSDLRDRQVAAGAYPEVWPPSDEPHTGPLAKLAKHWQNLRDCIERRIENSGVDAGDSGADPIDPSWRHPFELDAARLDTLGASLRGHPAMAPLCRDLRVALFGDASPPPPESTPALLAPLHRFVVTALVRLDPELVCGVLWTARGAVGPATVEPVRRAQFIAAGRDPLLMLLRDFGIVRFATTNYDEDIERAISDLGYEGGGPGRPQRRRATDPGRGLSRNALGMTAHDTVFRHLHAAELLRFAAARSTTIQVVHLHGRVRPCEPLVVTEGDYQALYLQRTEIAEAANDAISLALRSNTMLFVGSGMSEDDILRPMRQFVTERKSFADRSGVVLLPADASRARQIQEVIALYGRYGVLTKHFGVGDSADDLPPGEFDERRGSVRWLDAWLRVRGHLDAQLHRWQAAIGNVGADDAWIPDAAIAFGTEPTGWGGRCAAVPSAINGVSVNGLVQSLGLGQSFDDLAEIRIVKAVAGGMARLMESLSAARLSLLPNPWLSDLGVLPSGRAGGTGGAVAAAPPEAIQSQRLIAALRALLQGLGGALRALALVLELGSLHRSRLEWKRERTVAPLSRPVGAQRHHVTGAARTLVENVFTRNRLALRHRPVGQQDDVVGPHPVPRCPAPATDRFLEGAPSHSFSCFEDALRRLVPSEPSGRGATGGPRRLIVLLARRGLGKGHFFEMMAEAERVKRYVEASWNLGADGRKRPTLPPRYAVACYVNLGVSLEFLSAFDRLSLVLEEMASRVFSDSEHVRQAIHAASRDLERNRLARLQAILGLYAKHAGRARERVLISFNGFGQFFDWHGVPKNAQLHRLLEALIGERAARVPIDVLMICQESDLPRRFTVRGQQLPIQRNRDLDHWSGLRSGPMVQLYDSMAGERQLRKARETRDRLCLAVADRAPPGCSVWVHVLRGAPACATIGKYFPDVALAIALRSGPVTRRIGCTPAEVRAAQDQTMRAMAGIEEENETADGPVSIHALTLGLLWRLARNAASMPKDVTVLPVHRLLEPSADRSVASMGDLVDEVLGALRNDPNRAASREEAEIDERFRALHHAVRENRYLLTIVCAAASERGWTCLDDFGLRWIFEPVAVNDWLEGVRLEVSNHLQDDAVDRLIGQVLTSHQQRHECGSMPPAWTLDGELSGRFVHLGGAFDQLQRSLKALRQALPLDVAAPTYAPRNVVRALCGPAAWRLQQRLLWHLAVMALEVQADVLATAPLVEADCALLVSEAIGAAGRPVTVELLRSHDVCRPLVELMLDLLVHRCLVFRMEPVRVDAKDQSAGMPPADSGWRFTIHRFLQRAILEHMQAPFVEFPKVDQFGLSLWATQPDELPRPNRSTAHDIAGLVAAWIGFPKNADTLKATTTFHWFRWHAREAAAALVTGKSAALDRDRWRRVTLPARMLRAALGVLRATYSVGVVSRFHDFDDDGGGHSEPDEGYFKQHHLQVRWLLEQAKRLRLSEAGLGLLVEHFAGDGAQVGGFRGAAMEAVSPFYVDELVWLNNECGLFCLVEGRLDNAAGMFRQALVAAEQVEGRDVHGALWCRIHLNLAIVDIERGRIREADERLAAIEAVPDENPILRILARGFRALVDHLSGNLERAQAIYRDVLADLVELRQLRAVAIFSRHLAELHRLQGEAAAVPALHAIEQSIAAATKGGHEDIRHLAMLSRVRLVIAGVLPAQELKRQKVSLQNELDAIEHYGQVMGMPRLLADVAYARALYLLNLGETRHAAHLAYRCLGLCGANGLRLRQMMGMGLLGRIYETRGLLSLSDSLLTHAYAVALECHYGNLRESARSPLDASALAR